jgi:hypothetical protein
VKAKSPKSMVLALGRTPWVHHLMVDGIMMGMYAGGRDHLVRHKAREQGGDSFACYNDSCFRELISPDQH